MMHVATVRCSSRIDGGIPSTPINDHRPQARPAGPGHHSASPSACSMSCRASRMACSPNRRTAARDSGPWLSRNGHRGPARAPSLAAVWGARVPATTWAWRSGRSCRRRRRRCTNATNKLECPALVRRSSTTTIPCFPDEKLRDHQRDHRLFNVPVCQRRAYSAPRSTHISRIVAVSSTVRRITFLATTAVNLVPAPTTVRWLCHDYCRSRRVRCPSAATRQRRRAVSRTPCIALPVAISRQSTARNASHATSAGA